MNFLFLTIGILIGIALSSPVFLGYVYFQLKGRNKIHETIQKVEQDARPQVKIFMPPAEETMAQQEIVEKNQREGRDTRLEELGL